MRDEESDTFRVLKGWDIGDAAQVICPECEMRFFVEGAAYRGKEATICPSCGHSERIDFKSQDPPPLTF